LDEAADVASEAVWDFSKGAARGTDLMLRFATIEPKAHAALDAAFRARSMVEPPPAQRHGKT
jgi:hypothetical protein